MKYAKLDDIESPVNSPQRSKGTIFVRIICVLALFAAIHCIQRLRVQRSESLIGKKITVLISIDGFRQEYLSRGITPFLSKLVETGASAKSMLPVFPSNTFPNHFTLVTGLYPASHGIVNNRFYDPVLDRKFVFTSKDAHDPVWWQADPIWNSVQDFNKTSGVCFWPGSEAKIFGRLPNLSIPYDHAMESNKRFSKLLSWVDSGNCPDLLATYLDEVDAAGHLKGPDSEAVNQAIMNVDSAIEMFVKQMNQRKVVANYVIVSDHGMTNVSREKSVYIDDYIDTRNLTHSYFGPVSFITPKAEDLQKIYLQLLGASQLTSTFKVFLRDDIPKEYNFLGNNRIAPILVVGQDGWSICTRQNPTTLKGNHGFTVDNLDIHSIFIANGPNIKNIALRSFESVEVYDLLARLLEIQPNPNNSTGILQKIYQ